MTPNKTLATYWFNKYIKFIIYSVALRIQSECWKIRTRKNSVFVHFYTFHTVSDEIVVDK